MPDIYRYEWTGPRTGITYRLDFSEPSASPVGATVETLQEDALREVKDFAWEFDTFPIGLATPVKPKLTFSVDATPDTLMGWLTASRTTHTITIATGVAPDVTVDVAVGVNVALYQSGDLVWYGVQDVATRARPDLQSRTMEIAFNDALQLSMKAITLDALKAADYQYAITDYAGMGGEIVERTFVADSLWKDGSWYYELHRTSGDDKVWGIKRRTMFDAWEDYVTEVLDVITRRTTTVSLRPALELNSTNNRLQRYSATEPWPSATILVDNDVYLTPYIYNTADNEFLYSLHDEWARNYPSMYDLIADICKQSLRACAFWYSDTNTATLNSWAITSPPVAAQDVTELIRDAQPDAWARTLQIATASDEFAQHDDYDKIETPVQGGRNDIAITIPTVFRKDPVADDYLYSGGLEYATGVIPLNRLYHLVNPNVGGAAFSQTEFVRLHSWWTGDGSSAPTSATFTYDWNDYGASALAEQQEWGMMKQAADWCAETFGHIADTGMPSVLTGKVPSDLYNLSITTPDCQPFYCKLTVDVPSYDPAATWLANYPTEWWVIKWNGDLKTELAEVECYGY